MDRAAKLADLARIAVDLVGAEGDEWPVFDRNVTRRILTVRAEHLGFAPNEISAAVDQALTDAGTTP